MYILDKSLFFPLIGSEFSAVELKSFSSASLQSKYGKPQSINNIEEKLDVTSETEIVQEAVVGMGRFCFFISDSLSFLDKFMILDLSDLNASLKFYKEYSKSEVYNSRGISD